MNRPQCYKKIFYVCIYLVSHFWLHWLFLAACGLSLAVESRGFSLVVVCRFLTAVASFIVKHGLEGASPSAVAAHWFLSAGPVVVAHGLSCLTACGIFLDQRGNCRPLHCKVDS